MRMRSTLLERFSRLDPGLVQVKVILAVALLGFIAVLAVAVPAVLLVRYDGHPMSQVWIMAVTICSYVFLLLQCIWRPWPFYTDLARLTYGLLLASSAASEIGPRAAIVALHLTTVYAAAYFGYALALHRLGARTERANRGGALPLPHPTCRTRAQARSAIRTLALTALGVMAVWSAFLYLITGAEGMPDELDTISVLSFLGWMNAVPWVVTVGIGLLRGALFPAWVVEPATFLLVVCGAVVSLATRAMAGPVCSAVFQLLLLMALAAVSGYCLAVYITYLHVATAAADDHWFVEYHDATADDHGFVEYHDAAAEMVIQQEELPLEHGD